MSNGKVSADVGTSHQFPLCVVHLSHSPFHISFLSEEQVAELESVVKDLKVELSEQEENAEEVIKKWQESCTALEERNRELLASLESSSGSDVLNALQAELAETEKSLADAKDALGNDGSVLLQWQGTSQC